MPTTNWLKQSDTAIAVLRLTDTVEALLASAGDAIHAAIIDHVTNEFLWEAMYPTVSGAKRGVVANAKRLDLWEVGPLPRNDDAPDEVPPTVQPAPRSIWDWEDELFSFVTAIEGKGKLFELVVTPTDYGAEGDVILDTHVFRQDFADVLAAKRGTLARAQTLLDWAA